MDYPAHLPRVAIANNPDLCDRCVHLYGWDDFDHCRAMPLTAAAFGALDSQRRNELVRLIENGLLCPWFTLDLLAQKQ